MISRPLLALLLAFVLSPAGTLRAAEEVPPCFGTIEMPAQSHAWVAQAWADFDLLLGKLGMPGGLDPASLRIKAEGGDWLPCRFEAEKKDSGRGLVVWQAPAESKDLETARFRIYFAPRSGHSWKPTRPLDGAGPNLLPNGGFEGPKDEAGALIRSGKPELVQVLEGARNAHSGERCLKMLPRATGETGISHSCEMNTLWARVQPGQQYSVRVWHRGENVRKGSVAAVAILQVYWNSDDQNYVKHDNVTVDAVGAEGWTEWTASFEAPPKAARASLHFYFMGSEGTFFLDDLEFAPAEAPRLNAAQTVDGSKKAQAWMQGEGIWRFDFGPDKSAAWPGFTPLGPSATFTDARRFGWLDSPSLEAVDRAQPDALGRDYVLARERTRFAVNLPDGDYTAWVLQGDSGFGARVLPKFTRGEFGCEDRVVGSLAVPDAKTWYATVMFRHFKDWWRPGVDVYDRFIASRFTETTFPFKARRGRATFFTRAFPSAG